MRKLFFISILLSFVSCGYKVTEHVKRVNIIEGYECVRETGFAVKICKTVEECNEYCDKMNNPKDK